MDETISGLFVLEPWQDDYGLHKHQMLPLISVKTHSLIQSSAYHSRLTQTFINPLKNRKLPEASYTFPLFDGVSVVDFECHVGGRIIKGLVLEKEKAQAEFEEAVERGETAGLLDMSDETSDVFTTTIANIPPDSEVVVKISYVGELKHDSGVDGLRLVIPTAIAPRYGSGAGKLLTDNGLHSSSYNSSVRPAEPEDGMQITVDIDLGDAFPLQKIISPSHPVAVSIGTLSTSQDAMPAISKGSATLALGEAALDKDFILQVVAKDSGQPQALLETHPELENQHAIMATFVPKFNIYPEKPEIIFVADRSGSMGSVIPLLVSALRVFVKSLSPGVYFNICSFGYQSELLWEKSKKYSAQSMNEALAYVQTFAANFGGTETLEAVRTCVESRRPDIPTELMLLTDGDIWQQDQFFEYLNQQVEQSKGAVRLFSLGIGQGTSHALLEGCARAGRGFSQSVAEGERLDGKVVRMLKGALSPHISESKFWVEFEDTMRHGGGEGGDENNLEDEFEIVRAPTTGDISTKGGEPKSENESAIEKQSTSLFDPSVNPDEPAMASEDELKWVEERKKPEVIYAPWSAPALFPFSRTTVFALLSPTTAKLKPTRVFFHATTPRGVQELEIPITTAPPGASIHQLAARKAILELEEGRGWIAEVKDDKDIPLEQSQPTAFENLAELQGTNLSKRFQVASKWCSFVAVETSSPEEASERRQKVMKSSPFVADELDISAQSSRSQPDRTPNAAYRTPTRASILSHTSEDRTISTSFGLQRWQVRRQMEAAALPPSAPTTKLDHDEDKDPALVQTSAPTNSQPVVAASPVARFTTWASLALQQHVKSKAAISTPQPPNTILCSRQASVLDIDAIKKDISNPSRQYGIKRVSTASQKRDRANGSKPSTLSGNAILSPSVWSQQPTLSFGSASPAGIAGGGLFCSASPAGVAGGSLFGAIPPPPPPPPPAPSGIQNSWGSPQMHALNSRSGLFSVSAPGPASFGSGHPQQTTDGWSDTAQPTQSLLDRIVEAQAFDGSWSIDSVPWPDLSVDAAEVERLGKDEPADKKDILSTVLVVLYLQHKLLEERDAWELLVEKAQGWIEAHLSADEMTAVFTRARQLLSVS